VEIDQMTYIDNSGNGHTAGTLSLDGIPVDQYRRACIELVEFPQNGTNDVISIEGRGVHDPLTTDEKDEIQDARTTSVSIAEYWTVHLVSTFYEYSGSSDYNTPKNNTYGWAAYGDLDNTAFVYTSALDGRASLWNNNPANAGNQVDTSEASTSIWTQVTITHEIGHLMSLVHSYKGGTDSVQSVMSGDSTPVDDLQVAFQRFTLDEIKQLQAIQKPR
jgi:hypothetical protein